MVTETEDAAIQDLDQRVSALESGANSWAALVGEDVRVMRKDLDALIAVVEELKAKLA